MAGWYGDTECLGTACLNNTTAPCVKPLDQTAQAPCVKPLDQTAQAPCVKPLDQTAQAPCVKPLDKTTQAPCVKPLDKTAQAACVKPLDQTGQAPCVKPLDQTGQTLCVYTLPLVIRGRHSQLAESGRGQQTHDIGKYEHVTLKHIQPVFLVKSLVLRDRWMSRRRTNHSPLGDFGLCYSYCSHSCAV